MAFGPGSDTNCDGAKGIYILWMSFRSASLFLEKILFIWARARAGGEADGDGEADFLMSKVPDAGLDPRNWATRGAEFPHFENRNYNDCCDE